MEKIKNAFKSLVEFIYSPQKIASFYNAKALTGLFFIFLSLTFLIFPVKWVLEKNITDFGKNNQYVKVLYDINDQSLLTSIKDSEFKIESKKAYTKEDTIYKYKTSVNDTDIYFVFDCYNTISNKLNETYEKCKNINPNLETDILKYVAILAIIDENNGKNIDDSINNYIVKDEDYLTNKIDSTSYLDVYGIDVDDNKTNYLIVYEKEYIYMQIPLNDIYSATTFTYVDDLNTLNYYDILDFIVDLNNEITESLIANEYNNYVIYFFIYMIFTPLALALVLKMLSSKKYALKFGGCYKIASLLTLVPAIICMVLSLFMYTSVFYIYCLVYVIYGVIMFILSRKYIEK